MVVDWTLMNFVLYYQNECLDADHFLEEAQLKLDGGCM